MIHVRFLGGAAVSNGSPAGGSGTLQRHRVALLALLACAPQRQLSRDKLVAHLWPEADSEAGQNLLRVALHALRRAAGSEALVSDGAEIRLDASRVSIDVIEFESALEDGRLEEAVGRYGGAFMDGFHLPDAPEFDHWMEAHRAELRQKCSTALRALATAADRNRVYHESAEWWRRAAALDPYDSTIAMALMRTLGTSGDVAGAVQHARSHVKLLEYDLGVQPPPGIVQLEAELREGRFAAAAAPVDLVPSSVGGPPVGPLPESATATAAGSFIVSRRRVVAATVLAATVLAAMTAWLTRDARDLRPNRVLVLPLANQTGDTALTVISRMAADWVTQGLQRSGLVEVVDPYTAFRLASADDSAGHGELDTSRILDVASVAGTGSIVWGSLSRRDSVLVMHSRVIAAHDGTVLRTLEPIDVVSGDISSALEALRARVAGALATLLDERLATIVASSSPPPTFEAYQEYVRGLDRYGPGGYAAAAKHFERAAQLDSTFILARFWMAYALSFGPRMDSIVTSLIPLRDRLPPAERFGLDMFAAGSRGDWEAQLAAARAAADLAPQSSWRYNAADFALQLGRPSEALAEIALLDPTHGWVQGHYGYWLTRANAQHQLGDYDAELETGRLTTEALAKRGGPLSVGPSWPELRALIALGRFAEVERGVTATVSRPAGSNELFLLVGRELRAHGQGDRARTYFERCLENGDPSRVLCLYELGRYEEAYAITSVAGPQATGTIGTAVHVVAARLGKRSEVEDFFAQQRVWPGATLKHRRLLEEARVAAIFGDTAVVRDRLSAIPVRGWVRQMLHIRNELDGMKNDPVVRRMLEKPLSR